VFQRFWSSIWAFVLPKSNIWTYADRLNRYFFCTSFIWKDYPAISFETFTFSERQSWRVLLSTWRRRKTNEPSRGTIRFFISNALKSLMLFFSRFHILTFSIRHHIWYDSIHLALSKKKFCITIKLLFFK